MTDPAPSLDALDRDLDDIARHVVDLEAMFRRVAVALMVVVVLLTAVAVYAGREVLSLRDDVTALRDAMPSASPVATQQDIVTLVRAIKNANGDIQTLNAEVAALRAQQDDICLRLKELLGFGALSYQMSHSCADI